VYDFCPNIVLISQHNIHIVILSLFVLPPIKQISIVVLLLRRIDRLLHQWLVYLADKSEAAINPSRLSLLRNGGRACMTDRLICIKSTGR